MLSRLQAAFPDALLVHRLDRDTSGVMIFALTQEGEQVFASTRRMMAAMEEFSQDLYFALAKFYKAYAYGGEDSPDDITRGIFAGQVGIPRLRG